MTINRTKSTTSSLRFSYALAALLVIVPSAMAAEWDELRQESSRLFLQRDFDGSIKAEKRALAIAEKAEPNSGKVIHGLHAIASAYRFSGRSAEAIPYLKRELAICEKNQNESRAQLVLRDLAAAHREAGQDKEAARYSERAESLKK